MEFQARKCDCGSFASAANKCPIVKMPIFAGVPRPVWEVFCKKRICNDYRRGNIIFYEGNRPFGMYFLCRGRVKIVRTDSGLHSSIPRVKEAPDLLGERAFLANESYRASGEALEDCRICFLDGPCFEEIFLGIPQVCRAILTRIAAELGRAEEHLLDFGFKTVRSRLAKYIVDKAAVGARPGPASGSASPRPEGAAPGNTAKGGPCEVRFPETRADLAQILGTSPEVLCRLLAEFRKKSWIAVSGKVITVKDKPRLDQISRL